MIEDLIVAIDRSENGGKVIVVIGASEHVLKREVVRRASWVKHFRRIPSAEKKAYMRRFPSRFDKIRRYLSIIRIFRSIDKVNKLINALSPGLVIVDDKIFDKINYENKIRESSLKPKYMEVLCLLADNVANYFRLLRKSNRRKYLEALRSFEK